MNRGAQVDDTVDHRLLGGRLLFGGIGEQKHGAVLRVRLRLQLLHEQLQVLARLGMIGRGCEPVDH